MSDPSDIVGLVIGSSVGGAALWKFGEWLVVSKLKKGEVLEAKAESELERKVDLLLSKVTSIESESRVAAERAVAANAVVAEVKARIDGVSNNHGGRIGALELDLARQGERIAAIESPRPSPHPPRKR